MGQRKVCGNLMFLWRENFGAFHAEVVVLSHPPMPRGLAAGREFSPREERVPQRIPSAAMRRNRSAID